MKPWFDANGMVPTNKFRRNMTNVVYVVILTNN